ncbi:MAG TPA: FAD-dependent monooxygenase [Thiobacillaceae bacterium]|nr:FAD-dependent monooxygenase [Thiobacillaceae bacterium]HNU64681.1 FAD-dependent monooxygenase [Thiobacillaceae bacterium]
MVSLRPSRADIAVLGGGLNGAALVSALRHSPYSVVLVEPRPPQPPREAWDSRLFAFSPGNVAWLRSLQAWETSDPDGVRCQAVQRMRIHGDGDGCLDFDALDAGLPELAWIAENGRLQACLWRSWRNSPNVRVISTMASHVIWGGSESGGHHLHLINGSSLHARLLVAADGADSWLRQQAGIDLDVEDYRHIGVVANFATERPHRGTAFQWFRPDGVLAWLPLPGNRISMVWSTPPEHAAELRALSPERLAEKVAAAGDQLLGRFTCITPAAGFPLKRRRAREWVRPGLVLLGDAAHTVHPLAGQGVNLGFRDSRLLTSLLAEGGDPGEIGRLTAYAARRREDVASMQLVTGGLKKLFACPDGLSLALRNLGMNLTNHLTPLNQALIRHAIL